MDNQWESRSTGEGGMVERRRVECKDSDVYDEDLDEDETVGEDEEKQEDRDEEGDKLEIRTLGLLDGRLENEVMSPESNASSSSTLVVSQHTDTTPRPSSHRRPWRSSQSRPRYSSKVAMDGNKGGLRRGLAEALADEDEVLWVCSL
ncbi:unnamed protein product [Protopolystoma xenopodis]|uniref:Uncharacterized protein n=1 Tax=Protopolystoma xenopodis TaxID=117903 RepID=A0A3S5BTG4_9PLAT|nr:unnamed protein product [Protopolystoma xenopodis]